MGPTPTSITEFFPLKSFTLFLHMASIRLLFLVKGKEPPILKCLNFSVTLHEIDSSI